MTRTALNETERLDALNHLSVLDTPGEPVYDALAEIAALVCDAPISLISLVDHDRQWFKANVGMRERTQTPRAEVLCNGTTDDDGVLEIGDLASDPRVVDHPLRHSSPDIRFYAGAPLRLSDGAHVGALCVMDRRPRTLTAMQRKTLTSLAVAASEALDARRVACALTDSEKRFRALSEAAPLGVFMTDAEGGCRYTNERWQMIFGVGATEALGHGWARTLHPDDCAGIRERWASTASRGEDFDMTFRVCHDNGTIRQVRAISRPIITDRGTVSGHIGSVEDLTERMQQQAALRHHEQLLEETGALANVGAWTLDLASSTLCWSDQTCRIHGIEPGHEVSVEEAIAFYAPEARSTVRKLLQNPPLREAGWDMELPLVRADGRMIWVRTVGRAEFSNGRAVRLLGAVHDVTDHVLQHRALADAHERLHLTTRYRATHDALTGLLNRDGFETCLHTTLDAARQNQSCHALMYIDLDQFKLVNDACGHFAGDRLLQQMASLLVSTVGAGNVLARLGGDEFGVILEDCPPDRAERMAQIICERVEDFRFEHEGRRFRVGTSIGLVLLDRRWHFTPAAMQAADSACYVAKEAGRNRVHTWLDSDVTLQARRDDMQWATRITRALDDNRFEIHAQRIQAIDGGSDAVCAELLIRLRDDDGRLITPNCFLPAAERFHLATRIDWWVLTHALQRVSRLSDPSTVDTLWINLSGQSVGDREFHRDAIRLLKNAGRSVCQRLCVEITETAAVTDVDEAIRFIHLLRALGIRIALDDFGAGASSLGYLKLLPVDALKIDGQFIKGLLDDPLDDTAVRCFVDIARILDLTIVAECVDNTAVLARLKSIGIDLAQGFLLHRPEPLDRLLDTPA